MKTDPKNQNAFRAPSQPEQALNSTPRSAALPASIPGTPAASPQKLYEVTLHRTDYRYSTLEVWADSQDEAEHIAEKNASLWSDSDWQVADRDLYTYSVEPCQEGRTK